MRINTLNTMKGDFDLNINLETPQGRAEMAGVVEDMLRRGYALFLEDDGGETHRVLSYDSASNEFEVRETRARAKAKIRVVSSTQTPSPAGSTPPLAGGVTAPPEKRRPGRAARTTEETKTRATAVPPMRGG